MKNTIVPLDVVMAGTYYVLDDTTLEGYHTKHTEDDYFFYKNIILENGAVFTLSYRKEFSYLSAKFSAPKMLYGTNAKELRREDIAVLISTVNGILAGEQITTDFSAFKISRIELSRNYICKSEQEKMNYINILKRRTVLRKKSSNYITSAVAYNKSCRLTIYDKKAEMIAHNDAQYIEVGTDKILRVEYKVGKAVLRKHTKNLTVENILCNLDLGAAFIAENKKAGIFDKVLSYNRFFNVLEKLISDKSCACQKRIVAFYKDLNAIGESAAKEKYSQYIFNTYTKIMKGAGYNIMYSYSNVHFVDFCNSGYLAESISKEQVRAIVSSCRKATKTKTAKYHIVKVGKKCLPCLPYPLFLFDSS